ncbi:hypothetical protein NMG60_11005000 [Bertholletia excelsa]
MFEGWFKSKFYTKCKSATTLAKTRIEMIKRKRSAMQKYLKNDIAELLKNSHNSIAYGRAEGFLVELNMTECYELVEKFCGSVLNNVSSMAKHRECPEECREAVPSLMFAAARFADLPELRELRSLFAERYGNSLEAYVDKEFAEKLKASPPTKDEKIQLLQDIAHESGIEWDSKVLVQELYKLQPPARQAQYKSSDDDGHKPLKRGDKCPQEIYNPDKDREQLHVRIDGPHRKEDLQPCRRKDSCNDKYQLCGSGNDQEVGSNYKNDKQIDSKSETEVSEERPEGKKPFYYKFLPPPYTKPKSAEAQLRSLEVHSLGSDRHREDGAVGEARAKPRSVRSRPLRIPPVNISVDSDETNGVNISSDGTGLGGLKMIGNVEERRIGGQLMHDTVEELLSDADKMKAAPKPSSPRASPSIGRNRADRRAKAASLPAELASPTKSGRGHVRASSFEVGNGSENRKVLDYDDFMARLAALQGK